jgi:hypothetical protein
MCPACGFVGSLDASNIGKSLRCRRCGHRFVVPEAGEQEADEYMLDGPAPETFKETERRSGGDSTFVSAPVDDAMTAPKPRRKTRKAPRSSPRKRGPGFAWRNWLIGLSVVIVLALITVSFAVPSGTLIAACAVIVIGCVMLLAGFLVGAYGAFREDVLYGLLYVLIPLYTAYYLVTRWDDLWVWCACSTAGVGLILLGTEIARWSGLLG